MAKIIHCYPAKSATISICCNTCEYCHPHGQAANEDVCVWGGEESEIIEPKKWRCENWELDHNINLNA